jgi:hypothetical protein
MSLTKKEQESESELQLPTKETATDTSDEPYTQSFAFFKSPEGVAEYEKLELKYPRTMPDDWYDRFLKVTK